MPQYLKNDAIALITAGIDSYILALYGLVIPQVRERRINESRYAPVMGLLGASVELLVKACVVQAKGSSALYADGNINSGVYKFGSDSIEEFKLGIKNNDITFNYIWKNPADIITQQKSLLEAISRFKLLQRLRANGLHAGKGCSKDVALVTANDIHDFIKLLASSKKLGAYLKNIPAPESTIRDREAIIGDLTRRCNSANNLGEKIDYISAMYLVLPFIPEDEPEWLTNFGKAELVPPQEGDINYLVRTLNTAHSIYLMKTRGGHEGVPVRIENSNPDALPISVQYLKRELNSIPDKFHNDNLTANTRLEQENRLDLPIEDFVVDIYALGIENSNIILPTDMLTAQQTWAYIASSNRTAGNPRPYWFIIRRCNELDKLRSLLQRAATIGNAYLRKRTPLMLDSIQAYKEAKSISFTNYNPKAQPEEYNTLKAIKEYYDKSLQAAEKLKQELTPMFTKRHPLSEPVNTYVMDYLSGTKSIGITLENILKEETLSDNDKKVARMLLPVCYKNEDRNGLVAVMRTAHLEGYQSNARKMMYYTDFIKNGPLFEGIDPANF